MEDDHFEDFTTASEWETFIARLEQLLSECMAKPVDPSNVTNNWLVMHDRLLFADFPFKFSYFKRLEDNNSKDGTNNNPSLTEQLSSNKTLVAEGEIQLPDVLATMSKTESEFPPKFAPHIVSEYFSLFEFAVLSSAALEPVLKESKLKVLLSSACIAINNTSCNFPVFVQFHNWKQNYFGGIAEGAGIRTSFQMVMLQPPNPALPNHLSGLLDLFKSKIGSNLPCPIGISTHFFYKINSWPCDINLDSYPPELFELLKDNNSPLRPVEVDGAASLSTWSQSYAHTSFLPFGSLDDPFLNMDLVAGWPSLTEDVVVDSSSYSDLEPENAQEWHFSLKTDSNAEFRLYLLVEGIWKLKHDKRTTEQVLGKPIDSQNDAQNFSSALDKITRHQVSLPAPVVGGINQVIARRRAYYTTDPNAYEDLAPLSSTKMDLVVDFLFPDAKRNSEYPYPSTFQDTHKFKKEYINSIVENLVGVKSAPVGSLVWRISLIMGYLLAYGDQGSGSSSVVAHIWAELILELRFRVDNCKPICGLESGSPNIGSCLLNQKLQMLNCCIAKKMARECKQNEREKCPEDALESDADSDDEFFDCEEDNLMDNEGKEVGKLNKPSGRMRKNGKLRLINNGEPMYIPDTQDPAPLTEDVLEEQSKVMIELGDDAQGSELRAKMMSQSLQSDMQSFKAANPGAELQDFVRWYSPRDWIETDEIDKFGNPIGDLSPRMKLPGNMWLEVWSNANPVSARRQKRLFDDTKEAEKVLHWLSARTLMDISQLLFPCLVHVATMKVLDEMDTLPIDYEIPATFPQNVIHLSRSFRCVAQLDKTTDEISMYKNLVMKNLQQCEKEITQIRSFQMKFPSENIGEILNNRNCNSSSSTEFFPNFIKVPNGKRSDLGNRIFELFVSGSNETNDEDFVPASLVPQHNNKNSSNRTKISKFGKPYKRAFVLKYLPVNGTQKSSSGTSLPQRMSCLLKDDTFVLALTYSNKTNFL